MRYLFVLFAVICLGVCTNVRADSDRETIALGHLLAEIEAAKALVESAKQQADTGKRIQFNYDALRTDLITIQVGIEQYRAGIVNQPREIPAIVGDYRR